MDSNETRNLLKELLGPVGYAIARPFLRTVKIKFDAERRKVVITKDGKTHEIKFDEAERFVADSSQ